MRYDYHLPRSLQVRVQVDQDDPVNDAVCDAFGFEDDNFTAEVQGAYPIFLRNDAAWEFFNLMDEANHLLC